MHYARWTIEDEEDSLPKERIFRRPAHKIANATASDIEHITAQQFHQQLGDELMKWTSQEKAALESLLNAKDRELRSAKARLGSNPCQCMGTKSWLSAHNTQVSSQTSSDASELARLKRALQNVQTENHNLRAELDASQITMRELRKANKRVVDEQLGCNRKDEHDPFKQSMPPDAIASENRRLRSQLAETKGTLHQMIAENRLRADAKRDMLSTTTNRLKEWMATLAVPRRSGVSEGHQADVLRDTTIDALHQLIVGFREELEVKSTALAAKDEALVELHTQLSSMDGRPSPTGSVSSGGEQMMARLKSIEELSTLCDTQPLSDRSGSPLDVMSSGADAADADADVRM